MTIVGFSSPLFLLLAVEMQKEEFPSLIDFSKDIKKKREKDAME